MGTTDRLNDLQDLPCPDTPVGGGTPARTWGADVVTVNADGTVDCQPVNSRATKVGVGVPSTYKATIGDRVIITDLQGDPRLPVVIATVTAQAAEKAATALTVLRAAPLNPMDPAFGAKFDGVTDDTAAWNLLKAAIPATGAEVYVPPGKSLVPNGLSFVNIPNLRIRSAGASSCIHSTAPGVDTLSFNTCQDLEIYGLRWQNVGGRHGVLAYNCANAHIERPMCAGVGDTMMVLARCISALVVDPDARIPGGPYPAGLTPMQRGIVFANSDYDAATTAAFNAAFAAGYLPGQVLHDGQNSGCNGAKLEGGSAVIGRTQDRAIIGIYCENLEIDAAIGENSGGGIYLGGCSNAIVNGQYGENNPSDVELGGGNVTASVTNGATAVTGQGANAWNTNDGTGVIGAAPGKYLIGPAYPGGVGGGLVSATIGIARVASVTDDTHLTLESSYRLYALPGGNSGSADATQAGWGGPTMSAQQYRLVSGDIVLDNCTDCVILGGRGGAAIIMRKSSRNKLFCAANLLVLDQNCVNNTGVVTVNRAGGSSASAYSRIIDPVPANNNLFRILDWAANNVLQEMPLPLYTAATRPTYQTSHGDWYLRNGTIIFVTDAAVGSQIQTWDAVNHVWRNPAGTSV